MSGWEIEGTKRREGKMIGCRMACAGSWTSLRMSRGSSGCRDERKTQGQTMPVFG